MDGCLSFASALSQYKNPPFPPQMVSRQLKDHLRNARVGLYMYDYSIQRIYMQTRSSPVSIHGACMRPDRPLSPHSSSTRGPVSSSSVVCLMIFFGIEYMPIRFIDAYSFPPFFPFTWAYAAQCGLYDYGLCRGGRKLKKRPFLVPCPSWNNKPLERFDGGGGRGSIISPPPGTGPLSFFPLLLGKGWRRRWWWW